MVKKHTPQRGRHQSFFVEHLCCLTWGSFQCWDFWPEMKVKKVDPSRGRASHWRVGRPSSQRTCSNYRTHPAPVPTILDKCNQREYLFDNVKQSEASREKIRSYHIMLTANAIQFLNIMYLISIPSPNHWKNVISVNIWKNTMLPHPAAITTHIPILQPLHWTPDQHVTESILCDIAVCYQRSTVH